MRIILAFTLLSMFTLTLRYAHNSGGNSALIKFMCIRLIRKRHKKSRLRSFCKREKVLYFLVHSTYSTNTLGHIHIIHIIYKLSNMRYMRLYSPHIAGAKVFKPCGSCFTECVPCAVELQRYLVTCSALSVLCDNQVSML